MYSVIYRGNMSFNNYELTSFNSILVMWYIVAYYLGLVVPLDLRYKKPILYLYIFQLIIVFANVDLSVGRMSYDIDHLGVFLFIGDAFAIWSLLLISLYKDKAQLLIILFLSIICLYLIGSRSSLLSFIIVTPFIILKNNNVSLKLITIATGAVLLIVLLFSTLNFNDNRMFKFLLSGEDHSIYLRKKIFLENFDSLKNNWFLGDYGGQIVHGGIGMYIHNYLSLWRQFGFTPFLLFLILLFPFFKWFPKWLTTKTGMRMDFLFYAIIFLLPELILTRSYYSHFIWIFLGYMTQISNKGFDNEMKLNTIE